MGVNFDQTPVLVCTMNALFLLTLFHSKQKKLAIRRRFFHMMVSIEICHWEIQCR